jgi:hypothetical protein
MSSWFSDGGTPASSTTTEEEEQRQQASLVANDDLQNLAVYAQPSTRRAAAAAVVVEQGSIFDRMSSGGSIFDRLASGVSDMFIDSYDAVGKSSRPGDSSKGGRGRDENNNNINGHENTQRTVLAAAQRNTDQAEAAAKQMEQDMNWWKSISANDTGEEEDTPTMISDDPDLLALASEEHFGDSANHHISFDIVKKSPTKSETPQVEDPNIQSRVVQLPKSNQRKLGKVQEIVQWRERTIASGKSLTSELSDLDELSLAFEMLEPLMEWWRIQGGKEFAVKNRHLTVNESDECERKLKETYQWLSTNLQNKKGSGGSEAPNWLRGKNSETQGDGSSPFVAAGNLFGLPFGRGGPILAEQRAKEMEEALSWLRSNELSYDDPDRDDASTRTMNKINSMVPGAMGKDPVEVATTMEAALVWLRASDDASTTFHLDDGSVGSSKNIPAPGLVTPEGARARAMENALQALRANDASKDFGDDPSALSFKSSGSKLDAIPEARRSDIPDWLRKTDATYKSSRDDQSLNPSKVPNNTLLPLTPEEARTNDMANALEWLRSHETRVDVTKDNTTVPSFASGPDQKVNYATNGVDCFQDCGSRRTGFDDYSTASGKQSRGALSAEAQRAILMADDLNRLRNISAGIAGRNDYFSDIPAWTSYPGWQVGSTVDLLRSNNLDINAVDVPPRVAAIRNLEEVPSGNSAGIAGTDDSISDVLASMRHPGEQIRSAIDLLRSNKMNINAVDDLQVPLSSDDRARFMEHALNRLRSNNPDINNVDDGALSVLANLAGITMPHVDLPIDEKSKAFYDALSYLHINTPSLQDIDDDTVKAFADLSGIHMPREKLTEERKAQTMEDALKWLRENKTNPDEVGFEMLGTLTQLARISMPRPRLSTEARNYVMDNALDWLRSNSVDVDKVDDFTLTAITNLAGVPIPRLRLALKGENIVHGEGLELLYKNHPELEWLRQSQPGSTGGNDPTLAEFASIDYIGRPRGQPSAGDFLNVQSQWPPEQKKELEELLEWLLKNNPHMDLIDHKTIAVFSNLTGGPIPQGRLTTEEKERVTNDSLNWLRTNKLNPSDLGHATIAALTNLAGVSPPEGKPEEQIKAAEDALLWLDSNYPVFEDIDTVTLSTVAHLVGLTMPNGELLPEQKKKSAEEALDWLRTCSASPDDVVFDDTTLTSIADIPMLSRKAVPLDRKKNVAEKKMSWVRNSHPYLNDVDDPATDLFNNVGDIDIFNNFAAIARSAQVKAKPRKPSSEDNDPPEWSWHRNLSGPSGVLEPIVNPDVTDGSAPWASEPDEVSDDGRGPTPMVIPEDLYSEESPKESKQKPKGVAIPVWLMLTLAVMASVIGTASIPKQGATEIGVPPPILYDLTAPARGTWTVLPDLAVVPGLPCAQDSTCGLVMGAINPVLPERTRPLANIEGTCQHWAREWLRTSRDIMEFKPERIRQRFAMAILYCEFNGDNWLEGDFWLSDLHECDWYTLVGVDPCGRREQYQIIRSYGQQMRGTLPPELSMISTLWEVTLSDNLIEGTIPPEYYKLSKLETLGLAFNLFKGPIPDFVWEFEDMVNMDLAYNFFTGTIPDTVHLTEPNLRVLFLENNDLASTIPKTFGQLDWKRLHLDGNKFTGPVPSDINAPRIEEIMLHNNQLTGTFPAASFATEFAGKHSKLRVVTLNNNELSGDINEMCPLISDGRLQRFDVDLDKIVCNCCSSGD